METNKIKVWTNSSIKLAGIEKAPTICRPGVLRGSRKINPLLPETTKSFLSIKSTLSQNEVFQQKTFSPIEMLKFKCKNPKLRNIYFRIIHNDFFTHVRMKK
jgi:hypothetical protein